jgi:PAS domain S-box-containing protein
MSSCGGGLSSSIPDVVRDEERPTLSGDRLAELVSVIAEAPDFSTAATFLVAQFVDVASARHGLVLTLDPHNEKLDVVAAVGFPEGERPAITVRIDDHQHPFAAAALSLHPIECDGSPAPRSVPFDEWVAIPFPQPQFRGAPMLLSDRALSEHPLQGCRVRTGTPRERRRRLGHAPCGIVVLDTSLPDTVLVELSYAAALAGPVLSRMFAVEEFRRSAERLDQQRDLLSAIINSLPDPIIITDSAANMIVQNRRAEHLLSIGEADSEGRRRAVEINNLLFTSHLAKTAMGAAPQGGGRELNMVDPDEGTDLLFEVLTHELPPEDGGGRGSMVSVLRDVTDLRRAAGELERQVQRARLAESDVTRERDRLDLILENVADPILVTDDRSDIILMNGQAEQLFSLETSGDDDRRTLGTQSSAVRANDTRFTTFISDFTLSPDAYRRQQMNLIVPQTGTVLPVEVVSGKITNERGEPLAIVSVLHDLTEQAENERLYKELKTFSSQLEERIREATADLEEQNARLQWQSQELEKANRLKSEFLASMSHELRTPINALIGYTALLLDRIYGDINDQQYDALTRVQIAAQHLLALINDILDLAKIEAGRMPLHLEDVRIDQLVEEITAQVEPLVKKKGLTFTSDVSEDTPVMFTDRVKVKQILLNLLSNAIKFTHSGGIAVTARPLKDTVEIAVSDSGIGIKEEHREAIWEDFRQVDQSITREFGGTGLGLSITRKLVEALGGEIRLTTEFREGSTFTIFLPVRTPAQEVDPSLPPGMGRSSLHGRTGLPDAGGGFAPPSPS